MSTNSTWINLSVRRHDILIQENYRPLYDLENRFSTDVQYPQMLMFIGGREKTDCQKTLFSAKGTHGHNMIHLRSNLDVPTRTPILIADCELHRAPRLSKALWDRLPPGVEQHSLRWHQNLPSAFQPSVLANLVYSKLILPFTNITCIFADDFGGTREVAKVLASWILSLGGRSLDLPVAAYPRIFILQQWTDPIGTFDEKLATLAFVEELRRQTNLARRGERDMDEFQFSSLLRRQFSELSVLTLPMTNYGKDGLRQTQRLRERLLQESREVQELRHREQVAFSTGHYEAFFHLACCHFASDMVAPFDFIAATRIANPIPDKFSSHVLNFVRLAPSQGLMVFTLPFIASAFHLDGFPPDMHIFQSESVFDKLYSKVLERVRSEMFLHDPEMFAQVLMKVKSTFSQHALRQGRDGEEAAASHRRLLRQFAPFWKDMFSKSTCLACIARSPEPELSLTCRHSLCRTCIAIHGQTKVGEPWDFLIDVCPLCTAPNTNKFSRIPSTAGVRCLSIDGGGPQALKDLKELEVAMQLPGPIQQHFDIFTGVGTGGLVALEICCGNDWSVDHLLQNSLVNRATRNSNDEDTYANRFSLDVPKGGAHMLLQRLKLLSPASFGLRDAWHSHLDTLDLRKAFGSEKTFPGCGGTKVGIVLTRTSNSSPGILPNYHDGDIERIGGYKVIRPRKRREELLWHVGCVALSLKGVDGYQSTSLKDPEQILEITLREQDVVFSRAKRKPDLLLVLGATRYAPISQPQEWIVDRRLSPHHREAIFNACERLLVSFFYVELVALPELNDDDTGFFCRAQLRCRLSPSDPAYDVLIRRLRAVQARFYYGNGGQSILCVTRQTYEQAQQGFAFSRHIEFIVRSLKDSIDVKLHGITRRAISISNCPYVIQTLIEDQRLHCVFGDRDHRGRFTSAQCNNPS